MAAHRRSTLRPDSSRSVVLELEGTLLKDHHPFPYFMLIAFEASGLLRFTALLLSYPLIRSLEALGFHSASLRLMVFLAVAGVRVSEIHAVARAVLPKFYVDDVDPSAWGVLSSYRRRVVVTQCPRVMVEPLVKEHLGCHGVVGPDLDVNRFGYATGLLRPDDRPVADRVRDLLAGDTPDVALCRLTSSKKFEPLCKEQIHPPFEKLTRHPVHPPRVIFHDGRLVCRPTPLTALLIILWIPVGVAVAAIRIIVGLSLPLWFVPYVAGIFGGEVIVRGRPPPVSGRGVLFVCTHRTLMDPVVLSTVVGRRIPAVTYSISRLSEILSPIPTVRLSRDRQVDADRIKAELEKGDLVVCPEGTTCREPFLLRFSALFAELTDRIVPVAMNYRVGFFHATTARGWKAMDPIFFFMNPRPVYEVTFLNQLPVEATCAAGKSPHDVANYVQRILAATLGFECTNFTRKDKYRVLAGNDGTVSFKAAEPWMERVREVLGWFLLH